nr:dynein heavy chain-like protein PF11_0240 [Maniola hyperantus]
MSQSTKTVSRKNQNTLERSLNDMLAKPVEMSKGKSLLLKMGWQGGGLGRDEDGIVEPIAPKATYAVKTIGLGHLTEKPKKPTKPFANISNKKLKHPEFQNHFCTNVLLYILEFVKNDEENKIVFEPRLRKLERKRIHQIVEKIRVSNNLDDFENFENFSDRHLELVEQIWVHNCYELWTESEGEKQHRRICLFKEAPAHVYLVTPEDLTENDEKNGDIDDKNGDSDININIKEEKYSENIVSDKQNDMISNNTENIHDTEKDKDNTMNRENCKTDQENDKLNSKDRKIDSLQDVKKEISEMTDSQMAVDINVDENNQTPASNTLEMTQKVKDSDFCCETIPNMETNEVIENDHENDKCNSEDSKIDTSLHIKKNIPELIDSQMAADININDNNQILVSNDNNTLELTQKVKDSKFCSEITPNMKISDDVIKKDLENDKFISEDTKIDKLEDIRKEISESTYSQIAMNINMDKHHQILVKNDHNTLEMSQKIEDSDFCIEIIPNMEISDVIIISSDESDSESTEMATNNDLSHEIKPNNDRNVEIIEENQQISVQNENKISEEVADINICNDIKFELKINEEYKKIDEKMPAKATNIKPKIENGGQNFNDYLNTDLVLFNEIENLSTGKRSILSKIVEYFKEFSSDETFKEFRFLGPFNSEQIMHINVFFNICMKQDNIEYCYEKHELLTTFDNDLVKFDVLEDNNGKRFIQKVEENPRVTI